MKHQAKAILGLAVFYTVVVALLEAVLNRIPVINWLALSGAFVLFAVLLLSTVMELPPRHGRAQEAASEVPHDQVGHLARTIDRAVFQHQPDAVQALDTKLKALVQSAYSIRAERNDEIESLFKNDDDTTVRNIERILANIEEWLS